MSADYTGRPYALVSTDGHAGANISDYRPYLEASWHDEFDQWAASIDTTAWSMVDDGAEGEFKTGASSFMAPVNWDSGKRNQMLEAEGIVGEVLFPNTIQPFYPVVTLAAPGPRDRADYERRWAGLKAHNRWLKDFCDDLPGRRFGLAQIFLDDVDNAVEEVRWAREAGLRGVLLPPDHHLQLQNVYRRSLDPLWAVCAELEMPVHRHGIVVSSDYGEPESRAAAQAVGIYESVLFGRRPLAEFILGGVLERHPNLQVVFTEVGGCDWVLRILAELDGLVKTARVPGTVRGLLAGEGISQLSLTPTEYFRRQCHVSSLLHHRDLPSRYEIGVDRMMWGSDFPHHEGTAGYNIEWVRASMSELPEPEIRALVCDNAAELYRADRDVLQEAADRVGPSVAQIATPLSAAEFPRDPNFIMGFPELSHLVSA